jgi:hypothetical protein
MTSKPLAACISVLGLCVAALSACGGVARGDKKTGAAGGASGAGAAGTNAGDLFGGAGSASSVAGAATTAEGGAAGVGVDGNAEGGVGAAPDAGNFACGASTCLANQICVHRQCGGGPVQCMAETDGGCPTGWHADVCASGQFGQQTACVPDPCTPPPAECADVPAVCKSALNCFCINQASVCLGPACESIAGRQVTCAGAE